MRRVCVAVAGLAWVQGCSLVRDLAGYSQADGPGAAQDAAADVVSDGDLDDSSGSDGPGESMDAEADTDVDDAASEPVTCTGKLTRCGNECVDIQSSSPHCGGCGYSCPGMCEAAVCQVSPVDACHGVVLTADGEVSYVWAHGDFGGLYRISVATGEKAQLEPVSCGALILLVGEQLFWTAECDPNPGVWRRSVTGGPAARINDRPTRRAFGIAEENGYVYWSDYIDFYEVPTEPPVISRAPVAGGPEEQLWTSPDVVKPFTIALREDWIYVADAGDECLKRLPVHKGVLQPEVIRCALSGLWGVAAGDAVGADAVSRARVVASFWEGAGVAHEIDSSGWQWEGLGTTPGYQGAPLLLDADTVYWSMRLVNSAEGGGSILRYRFGSFALAEEIARSEQPIGLARQGPFLYWCSLEDGLLRMAVD